MTKAGGGTHGHRAAAGIGYLIAGVTVFSAQDLIIKLLSGSYPLYQAMVIRSLTALPILTWLVWQSGGLGQVLAPGWRSMVGRGLVMFCAYSSYYMALAALPLATTAALYFTAPLFITVLSVVMLGEHVGPRRWAAVMVGFLGVLVMLRPGSDLFDWAALLAVMAGLTYALSMVMARHLGDRHGAAPLAFWSNLVFLLGALVMAAVFGGGAWADTSHPSLGFLTRGWVTPGLRDLALMMATGLIAAAGLTLLTQAYRIARVNVVAPFEYTAMVWSVLLGWLALGDLPDATGWTGIAMIIGAGLYVLYREGTQARATVRASESPVSSA